MPSFIVTWYALLSTYPWEVLIFLNGDRRSRSGGAEEGEVAERGCGRVGDGTVLRM